MRPLLAALCAATMLTTPAAAASLRPLTTLSAPVVRLSDLFDDAGTEAQRVLGNAPAPGGRIVVEAAQLAAIARQFGVDWRPASPTDRAVLERPGKLLPRDTVVATLRDALAGLGAPADGNIELPGFSLPLVPPETDPQLAVDQLDYDATSGRFTGVLSVTADSMPVLRLRVTGVLQGMTEVLVPLHRLQPGVAITAADVQPRRLAASLVHGDVAIQSKQVLGLAPKRALLPGQPMLLAELGQLAAVQKGAHVTMQLEAPGLTLLAQGVALEPGGIGDRIQVLNPGSHAVVEAEVVAADRVRVAPGTTPMLQAGGRPLQFSNNTFVRTQYP